VQTSALSPAAAAEVALPQSVTAFSKVDASQALAHWLPAPPLNAVVSTLQFPAAAEVTHEKHEVTASPSLAGIFSSAVPQADAHAETAADASLKVHSEVGHVTSSNWQMSEQTEPPVLLLLHAGARPAANAKRKHGTTKRARMSMESS
jgi:hypothetical protein